MEALYFLTRIEAPRERVWDVMLGKDTYGAWAKAFGPGSLYQGDWNEGSSIQFLGPDLQMGMASRIKEARKPEFISIEHIGIVMNGVIDMSSEEARKWAPSLENYTFKEIDNGTELSVSLEVIPEHKSMFEESWPEALALLKELVESQPNG